MIDDELRMLLLVSSKKSRSGYEAALLEYLLNWHDQWKKSFILSKKPFSFLPGFGWKFGE